MNDRLVWIAVSIFLVPVLSLAMGPKSPYPATPVAPREFVPPNGANVGRGVVKGISLPLDKRYSELTLEQQGLLKSEYEAMPQGDEPPFPLNGLRGIYKVVSEGQDKLLVEGDLSMIVEINSQGKATAVSVYKTPSPEMTQLVAAVLMLEPYKPAICGGKPCAMAFPFRVTLGKR